MKLKLNFKRYEGVSVIFDLSKISENEAKEIVATCTPKNLKKMMGKDGYKRTWGKLEK